MSTRSPFSRTKTRLGFPTCCDRNGRDTIVLSSAACGIEALESRQLLSVAAPMLKTDLPGAVHKAAHQIEKLEHKIEKKVEQTLNKIGKKFGVNLDQVVNVDIPKLTNNLTVDQATGNLVGTVDATVKTAFGSTVVPIDVEVIPPAAAAATTDGAVAAAAPVPILNLHIDPIHLNLLGLHVDTSPICLSITADPAGGLLGNLLAGLSGLLGQNTLDLGAITGLINQILPLGIGLNLNQITTQAGHLVGLGNLTVTAGGTTVSTPFTANFGSILQPGNGIVTILDLSLGPVSLNLLGLHVDLNNCATPAGPVHVVVTADPNGGLLGSLLAGLRG
jgi:hypothetical protein